MNALFEVWWSMTLRSAVLFAVTALAIVLLRPRRAAVVHGLWSFALIASLALPVAFNVLPRLWIPRPAQAPRQRAVQAAPAAREERPPIPWKAIALVWPAGAAVVCIRFVIDVLHVRRLGRASHDAGEAWTTRVRELAEQTGVKRPIVVYHGAAASMPVTWGVARPAILLPADVDQWSDEQQRAVLLHEIEHIRRHDCLTQILARAACALYWINPLVWIGARTMEHSREIACDQAVVSSGIAPSRYGGFLIDMARAVRMHAVPLTPIASPRGLEKRLRALDAGSGKHERPGLHAAIIALAFLGISAIELDARDGVWRTSVSESARVAASATDRVTIESSGGMLSPIRVGTWDRNEVEVVAEKATDSASTAAVAGSMITARRTGDGVAVALTGSDLDNLRVRLQVNVPAGAAVRVRNESGGVTVAGDVREVDARTDAGPFTIGDVRGQVRVITGGGPIRIGRAGGAVFAKTEGGAIVISGANGSAHAATGSGAIDVTLDAVSGKSDIRSEHGDVRVVLPRDSAPSIEAVIEQARPDRSGIKSAIPLAFGASRRVAIYSPDADAQWWSTTGTAEGKSGALRVATKNGVIRIDR